MSASRRWRRLRVLLVSSLVASVGLGALAWYQLHDRPVGNPDTLHVDVPRGATADAIVELLAAQKLAEHRLALYWALKLSGSMERVQAGVYAIPGDANALEICRLLAEPATAQPQLTVTLIPGESVWEAGRRVEAAGIPDAAAEISRLAADRDFVLGLGLDLPLGPPREPRADGVAQTWLEGFLFPETYFFAADARPEEVVERAAAQFARVWRELKTRMHADYLGVRQRWGLSDHELVVLASLVEEEVRVAAEAPVVAGVFYNRLAKGMRLQTDPSLMYHPRRVAKAPGPEDRRDGDNPYNTYVIPALPPGPICSPSRTSLEAVLRPARHDYLYFVARRDARGRHAFARSLTEHRANIERYLR